MQTSTHSAELSAALCAYGTARADAAAISDLRKSLPSWAAKDTPGHFLKHADEQTVVAVAALDQAIRSLGGAPSRFRDWAIVAAPRFIGRLSGIGTLDRYARSGGPSISPHLIPQHSLHSISGALSILLASRQPNFGVGGTADSIVEGLLVALTCPATNCPGTWVVVTGWNPEPQVNESDELVSAPACHAVVLGLERAANGGVCGRLRLLSSGDCEIEPQSSTRWNSDPAELCQRLAALASGGPTARFAWRLANSESLVLEARELVAGLSAAA